LEGKLQPQVGELNSDIWLTEFTRVYGKGLLFWLYSGLLGNRVRTKDFLKRWPSPGWVFSELSLLPKPVTETQTFSDTFSYSYTKFFLDYLLRWKIFS